MVNLVELLFFRSGVLEENEAEARLEALSLSFSEYVDLDVGVGEVSLDEASELLPELSVILSCDLRLIDREGGLKATIVDKLFFSLSTTTSSPRKGGQTFLIAYFSCACLQGLF